MESTNVLTVIVLLLILVLFVLLNFYQIKKTKKKILKIRDGKLKDKQLTKSIKQAKKLSKKKYVLFMVLNRVLFSIAIAIVVSTLNIFVFRIEWTINEALFLLFFLVVVFALHAIIFARSIWNLSRKYNIKI